MNVDVYTDDDADGLISVCIYIDDADHIDVDMFGDMLY